MRLINLFLSLLLVAATAAAQSPSQGETTCTFADGKQVSLRYPQIPHEKKVELPDGSAWPADNEPIYLFTQTDLIIGSVKIPAGAYGVYTIPGKKDAWDLVVTRDVKKDGRYDDAQDIGRVQMQTGKLSNSTSMLTAYFGHISPQTCTLSLDFGKQRGYTDFKEK